ncbi:MAG TPA: PD-(D/E)XK nuclease family protein, partial [Cyclobacteriaceae bacterium]
MKPFLKEVAESILKNHSKPEELTLVFPNRRAAIYFQKYFSDSLTKPSWAPRLITIEEFFSYQSDLRQPDHLSLVFRLYQVYQNVLGTQEPFDRFYFWGEMLLRDFEEVDKYLVNANQLFKDLSKLKELDETFDYLTEEQKQFLKDFWLHFEEKPSTNKEEFLKIWRRLPKIYASFSKSLKKEGLGYEGMIHREVANKVGALSSVEGENTIFIGFNALTNAEEVVISKYVEFGASIYWDLDSYYLNNRAQEAG